MASSTPSTSPLDFESAVRGCDLDQFRRSVGELQGNGKKVPMDEPFEVCLVCASHSSEQKKFVSHVHA